MDQNQIDLIYSPADGGWYAIEYDFANGATRISSDIYEDDAALTQALKSGKHQWKEWRGMP
jgi:hypothetical protein